VYRVGDYLWMLADSTRVEAYAGAIRALVKPGDRVLELGTGVGFFSVLAVRAGAAHVDAVDTNPAVHLGPRVAASNDCADRIAFHACDARELALPAAADVLLSDLRGPTPFKGRSLETLIDVRRRLLRPCGTIIAMRDTLYAAPSRSPLAFQRDVVRPLQRNDVSLEPVARVVYDAPQRGRVAAADLLAPGAGWLTVDYRTVDATDHSGEASWELGRAATVSGIAVWFESDLGGGFGFSAAPANETCAYGQLFLPFRRAVHLAPGDSLRIRIDLHLVGDDYVWVWHAWTRSPDQNDERLVVDQNSLAEIVIDPAALPATAETIVPSLGASGRALRLVLEGIEQRQSIGAVAVQLRRNEPDVFSSRERALAFVSRWVAELTKS
jgi:type I protein arginine methyltransferase